MELVIIDCLIMNYLFTISQISQTLSTTGTTPKLSHIHVKFSEKLYNYNSPINNQLVNQVRHILIILSILLLSSPLIGQETGVLFQY